MMLCLLKDEETNLSLFQKITAKIPSLKMFLQGYASDSEKALRNALAHEFPNALSFICYIHIMRNISSYCNETLRFSQKLTDNIINDIFGAAGLIYCEEHSAYQLMLSIFKPKWDKLEYIHTQKAPRFSRYFVKNKEGILYHHVLLKNVRQAGFGDTLQSTNVPESLNAKIKRWQNFELKDA